MSQAMTKLKDAGMLMICLEINSREKSNWLGGWAARVMCSDTGLMEWKSLYQDLQTRCRPGLQT